MPAFRLGIFFRPIVKPSPAKQAVSTWPAAALVISNMIGTGIFTALSFQIIGFAPKGASLLSDSVFPLVMLWVVGGVLPLCGALCYAPAANTISFPASTIPRSGSAPGSHRSPSASPRPSPSAPRPSASMSARLSPPFRGRCPTTAST